MIYDKEVKQRTLLQNRALHLWFTELATELNEKGLDMRKVLKPAVEIPWSGKTIKEYIWRPIMQAQLGKHSTTEMTTRDIDVIFDTINRHLVKFGLTVAFPSITGLLFNQEYGKTKLNRGTTERSTPNLHQ